MTEAERFYPLARSYESVIRELLLLHGDHIWPRWQCMSTCGFILPGLLLAEAQCVIVLGSVSVAMSPHTIHAWIRFKDMSILDPTYGQFQRHGEQMRIFPDEDGYIPYGTLNIEGEAALRDKLHITGGSLASCKMRFWLDNYCIRTAYAPQPQ